MKIRLLLLVLTLFPAALSAQPYTERARYFLDNLFRGKYAEARVYFDSTLMEEAPESALEDLHIQIAGFYGDLEVIDSVEVTDTTLVYLYVKHSHANIRWAVPFGKDSLQRGFFIKPISSKSEYQPPSYVPAGVIYETSAQFPIDSMFVLKGTITLPRVKSGKLPGIVLVHGSGPQDQDESLYHLKPFQDLAWGLAAQGFAVLRYDKRTKLHPEMCGRDTCFQMDKETADDAVSALKLLASRSDVDTSMLFVLGHSQGGYMAPRILEAYPQAKGAILMAAPARPLAEVSKDQVRFAVDSLHIPAEKAADAIRKWDYTLMQPVPAYPKDSFPFANRYYWSYIRNYDPVKTAVKTGKTYLILQGGRDFQVTDADFKRWKKAGKKNSCFSYRYYPYLNHPMIEGNGPKTWNEYELQHGNIPQQVMLDIAAWINAQRKK